MPLPIKGIRKLSAIDYPGKLCATVFLGGCNFRCGYCYNVDLVLRPHKLPNVPEQEILAFLKERRGWLDGICLGGGEPTIHAELPEFISRVKELGFLVKLDTNGSNPKMLGELIRHELVDYVAMDIKAPLDRYNEVSGVHFDVKRLKETIGLLRDSEVDYEFRTTIVPALLSRADLVMIARSIRGAKRYFLQEFLPKETLDPRLRESKPLLKGELDRIRLECNKYVPTQVRA